MLLIWTVPVVRISCDTDTSTYERSRAERGITMQIDITTQLGLNLTELYIEMSMTRVLRTCSRLLVACAFSKLK